VDIVEPTGAYEERKWCATSRRLLPDLEMPGARRINRGASPMPSGTYATAEDWLSPAVHGNLRALRAAGRGSDRRDAPSALSG